MLSITRVSGIGYLNDQIRIICEGSLIGFSEGGEEEDNLFPLNHNVKPVEGCYAIYHSGERR